MGVLSSQHQLRVQVHKERCMHKGLNGREANDLIRKGYQGVQATAAGPDAEIILS